MGPQCVRALGATGGSSASVFDRLDGNTGGRAASSTRKARPRLNSYSRNRDQTSLTLSVMIAASGRWPEITGWALVGHRVPSSLGH